jgi:hypothetical protein
MKIEAILGRLARSRDRMSMAQKNAGRYFHWLVGRDSWDRDTQVYLNQQLEEAPSIERLDYAIENLKEALHDLTIVRDELARKDL